MPSERAMLTPLTAVVRVVGVDKVPSLSTCAILLLGD